MSLFQYVVLRWDSSFNHEFHVCVIFQAPNGAQIISLKLSTLEQTRLAGSKRKREIEEGNEPMEKKARGEIADLSHEELSRIYLSSKRLEQWCHTPFFATTVTGCFIRVTNDSSSNPVHCVTEIVSVVEERQAYQFGSTRTNLALKLRHAGIEQIVSLRCASNEKFTESEFKQWTRAMMDAGMQVPTTHRITEKEQVINGALCHTFTEKDIDFIVERKNRFRVAPLNVAKRKIQLFQERDMARMHGDTERLKEILEELKKLNEGTKQPEKPKMTEVNLKIRPSTVVKSRRRAPPKAQADHYQGIGPFIRRKTRPIMFTKLKNNPKLREAIYAELDRRYGGGSTSEDTSSV
ncbi:RNA polymerase-associated protein RTF1 homolog isoform X2 [Paralichthys olivaceus]|uniref:RNA polymerase-associated protein RTF1 homolog isoform X1 n=1 Tax=Paralichthys olivaceus TaxID=8255 RepID=UPI003752DD4C